MNDFNKSQQLNIIKNKIQGNQDKVLRWHAKYVAYWEDKDYRVLYHKQWRWQAEVISSREIMKENATNS